MEIRAEGGGIDHFPKRDRWPQRDQRHHSQIRKHPQAMFFDGLYHAPVSRRPRLSVRDHSVESFRPTDGATRAGLVFQEVALHPHDRQLPLHPPELLVRTLPGRGQRDQPPRLGIALPLAQHIRSHRNLSRHLRYRPLTTHQQTNGLELNSGVNARRTRFTELLLASNNEADEVSIKSGQV